MTRTLARGRAALLTVPRTSSTAGSGAWDLAGAATMIIAVATASARNRRINPLRSMSETALGNAAPGHLSFPAPKNSRTFRAESYADVTPAARRCNPRNGLFRSGGRAGCQPAGPPAAGRTGGPPVDQPASGRRSSGDNPVYPEQVRLRPLIDRRAHQD